MDKLPIQICAEILDETNQNLVKLKSTVHLEYANLFLMAAVSKLDSVDYSTKVNIIGTCYITILYLQSVVFTQFKLVLLKGNIFKYFLLAKHFYFVHNML